jgi:hypothetical protein
MQFYFNLVFQVFLQYLPFYNFFFNELRCAFLWLQVWVGVCLIIVQAINSPTDVGATIYLFLVTPLVVIMAVFAVRARRQWLLDTDIVDLHSSEEVELKSRFALEEYIYFKLNKSVWGGSMPSATGLEASVVDSDRSSSHQSGGVGGDRMDSNGRVVRESEEDFLPLLRSMLRKLCTS